MRKHWVLFVIASLFFLSIGVFFLRPLSGDADFYHHIHTGLFVLTHHRLPTIDEWTFTASGLPWVAHSWLGGVVLYLVFRQWSFPGISMLLAGIAIVTFFLLFVWLRRLKIPPLVALVTLAIAAPVVATRWPNRPEVFAYPILISLFLVDAYAKDHPRIVWLLPVFILLWANLYGANVLIGLMIVGLLMIKRFLTDGRRIRASSKQFFAATLMSFPVSLLNGYGLRTVFYILDLRQIAVYQGEWAGIVDTFRRAPIEYIITFQYLALTFLVFVACTAILTLSSVRHLRKYPFYLLLAAGLVVPFFAFRQAPLATIVAAPLVALLLRDLMKRMTYLFIPAVIIAAGLIALSLWIKPIALPDASDPAGETLVSFLRNHGLTGRTYTGQQLGAYVSYYLDPGVKVFADTRDDLFLPTQVFGELLSNSNILTLAKKYAIDQFVLDLNGDGTRFQPLMYSADWAPVFIDHEHLVIVRAATARKDTLPALSAIDPFSQTGAKPGLEQQALTEYQSGVNVQRVSNLDLSVGNLDDALRIIRTSTTPYGPWKALVTIENNQSLGEIAIARQDCTTLKNTVAVLTRARRLKLIFSPGTLLPTQLGKYQAFATLICNRDIPGATKELQSYIDKSRSNLITQEMLWVQFQQAAQHLSD